jgi:hypothetical protein
MKEKQTTEMNNLQPIMYHLLPEVREILQTHHVKQAYFFGSVCTDKFNENSDIDMLIGFGDSFYFEGYAENFWDMEEKLENLFQRKIDLVPIHTLKNPYFIKSVNQTKVPIYE